MSEQQNSIEPLSGTGYSDLAEAGLLAIETAQAFLAFAEGKGFPVPAEYQTLPPLLKDLAGSALEEFCQAIAEVQRLYSPQRVRPLPIAIGKIKASDPYAALLRLHEQLQLGVKSAGKEKLVEDGLLREIFSFGVIAEDLELLRQKIEVHDRLYSCQTETPETTEPSPPETQAASEVEFKEKEVLFSNLLRIYAGKVSDQKFQTMLKVLASDRSTAGEKLEKIDSILPVPPAASAEALGQLLGVTAAAVIQTPWWKKNRKGKKDEETVGRLNRLRKKGEYHTHEDFRPSEDDED